MQSQKVGMVNDSLVATELKVLWIIEFYLYSKQNM